MEKALTNDPSIARRPEYMPRIFFALVLGAAPFVIDPQAVDPSGQPKLLFVLLAMGAFLAWWLLQNPRPDLWQDSIFGNPIVLCFAGYFLLGALSLCAAINPYAGIADFVRTGTTLLLLVVLSSMLLSYPACRGYLLKIFAVVGLLCAAIAWAETLTKWGWGIRPRIEMERVVGLMYNGNLHASFLLMLLPLVMCASFVLRGFWRWAAFVSLLALFSMLLLLQSRSAYAGLFTGALSALAVAFLCSRQLGLGRRLHFSALLAAVALAATVAGGILLAGDNPLSGRGSFLSLDPRSAAGSRLAIWDAALRMALHHPLLGVGAGNFALAVHQYYDISDPSLGSLDTNWQEPHNDFLWVFAEKGVGAALCYAGAFAFACAGLFRSVSQSGSREEALIPFFAIAGLVAYATVSLFDFPLSQPGHQTLLAFYLSVAVAASESRKGDSALIHRFSPAAMRAIVAGALLVCLAFATFAFFVVRQERYVLLARQEIDNQNWDEVVTYAQRADFSLNPIDRLGVPIAFLQGLGYLMSARENEALSCFELAAKQSPYRDFVQHNVAVLHIQRGRHDLAVAPLEGIVARNRHNSATRLLLAETYLKVGRRGDAMQLLRELPADFRPNRVRMLVDQASRASAPESAVQK